MIRWPRVTTFESEQAKKEQTKERSNRYIWYSKNFLYYKNQELKGKQLVNSDKP